MSLSLIKYPSSGGGGSPQGIQSVLDTDPTLTIDSLIDTATNQVDFALLSLGNSRVIARKEAQTGGEFSPSLFLTMNTQVAPISGLGPQLAFTVSDAPSGTETTVALIGGQRTIANNVGNLYFATNSNGVMTKRMLLDDEGRLLVGSFTGDAASPRLDVRTVAGIASQPANFQRTGSFTSNQVYVRISNTGTPGINMQIGGLTFSSNPSAGTYQNGAEIVANSESAWTAGSSYPTYIGFRTVAAGSTTMTERFRIGSDGTLTSSNLAGVGTRLTQVSSTGVFSPITTGANGTVLTVVGGVPAWASSAIVSGGRNVQAGTTYTIVPSDITKIIALTNVAARTITLPLANTIAVGQIIWLKDEAGTAATANVTVNRTGADTIDGATSDAIISNYGVHGYYSDGASAWFIV